MHLEQDNVSFVLVEPATDANVCAAARALKTMGFSRLCVINPRVPPGSEASYVAHGAEDILDHIEVFDGLEDAISEADLVIGTTRPNRNQWQPFIPGHELVGFIGTRFSTDSTGMISIVFGRECSGLTSDELSLCDILSFIPLASKRPALNLGQAVMLYAYLLAERLRTDEYPRQSPSESIALTQYRTLKTRLVGLLRSLGVAAHAKTEQQVLSYLPKMKPFEMNLVHHLLQRIEGAHSKAKE